MKQLLDVYAQSVYQSKWPDCRPVKNERAFMDDLMAFFDCDGAQILVWVQEGIYRSALRVEPHLDGYLITCLETAPEHRRAGYGYTLMTSVLKGVDKPVYAHIEKRNKASYALHIKCGFVKIKDYAVYVDGSVYQSSCTMRYVP